MPGTEFQGLGQVYFTAIRAVLRVGRGTAF